VKPENDSGGGDEDGEGYASEDEDQSSSEDEETSSGSYTSADSSSGSDYEEDSEVSLHVMCRSFCFEAVCLNHLQCREALLKKNLQLHSNNVTVFC